MPVEFPRTAADPAVSVVVPSVPGYDHSETVAALDDQSIEAPYEICVVDDADLDRSAARNVGLREVDADVVALTDDDTLPPRDWLAVAREAFDGNPELVCLEGRVYGGSRYRGTRHYVGCNLAVRRDAALAVGGFSTEFAGWREDTEFGWRMERDADGRCAYRDDFAMCHPTVPRTGFDWQLERRLRETYPRRYAEVLGTGPHRELYRWARSLGVTARVHRARNAVAGLLGRDPRTP